jgi:prophage regulatory protein
MQRDPAGRGRFASRLEAAVMLIRRESKEPMSGPDAANARPLKMLSKPEVLDAVGVSYPTIWSWMREGKFPRSREIAGNKVGWFEHEVKEWLENRPVRRLKGDVP